MLYSISYDLLTPGKNYQELWDALHAIGAERVLLSQWTVRRDNTTPKQIGDYCVRFMDANDRIFVTEVPANYAYRNLIRIPSAA
jgi:hypothetical protein